MVKGLYISALGMTTQMNKLDVVSNNIANVNTTGYKADGVITQSFSEELIKHIDSSDGKPIPKSAKNEVGKMSLGLFVDNIYTDFKSGSVKSTGGSLDLAMTGEGFFTVMAPDSEGNLTERYTRDGAFTISADGYLVTKDGFYVQGEGGNIAIPSGEISINANGEIQVNAEPIDTIQMTNFADKTALRKQGDSLYSTIEGAEKTEFVGKVEQGFLETSNVNSVKEMVEMITVSRVYEANQKMINTHDQTLAKAVTELGAR